MRTLRAVTAGVTLGIAVSVTVFAAPEAVALRGRLERDLLLTGELVAEEAVLLVAPHANIWPLQIRWLVEDGAQVRAGGRLVEFDNTQLTASLEDQRAAQVAAENALTTMTARAAADEAAAALEVERRRAALESARIDAAVPSQLMSRRELDRRRLEERKAELELAKAESTLATRREALAAGVEMQRIAVERARAQVAEAEAGISLLTLAAPRDGIVVVNRNLRENRVFQVGDTTWPGFEVARMPDVASLVAEARLFDVDDGDVEPGMAVTAILDAFPSETVGGRVRSVDGFAQETAWRSRRRCFRVVVDLDRIDPQRMLPGMSVKLVVRPEPRPEALLVPRASLAWSGGKPTVLLASGGSVEVTVAACSAELCEVAGDLENGSRLALARGGS